MNKIKSFTEHSRSEWEKHPPSAPPTNDDIKLGCLQRIATATELMAENHASLMEQRDRYKSWYEDKQNRVYALYRSISALRGVITKLKKKL